MLLKEHQYGLFIFSNQSQDYWHFINVKYDTETEKRRLFRRITISPEERLRTAAERISMLDLQYIQPDMFGLKPLTIQFKHDEAFDVEAVTKQFYKEYEGQFRELENDLCNQADDRSWAHDYSLQFLNRCMFIYFIQRKGWLGNDRDFLPSFWKSYQRSGQSRDSFVDNWLKVLFFEAFNNKFHGGHSHFPPEIREALSLAPYLNGGLFTENRRDQDHRAAISDRRFEQIIKFLECYNFTIAEDSPLDKEVAVDPEMIGKVYESLVNIQDDVDARGEAGIFYTPRTEIDLMCRLSLVNHLANHLGEDKKSLLYQLVFALEFDEKVEADHAVSKENLWPALNERLHDVTVLDPACGSGSFLVGMLNILDDLQDRANRHLGITEASYERKKRIIGQSLYGVDVMDWACHVAELRLWLALIIDAEFTREELHVRREPLLPYFSFKIRCGDSLVQEIGGINLGHISSSQEIPPPLKSRITILNNEKLKFYNNDTTCKFHSVDVLKNEEKRLFSDILDARSHKIQERVKALRRKLEGPQESQIRLDGTVTPRSHQMDLEASKYRQEIEALTIELAQTETSRKALGTAREVPFVWDIAFVEIFESEKEGFDIIIGNPPYVRQEAIADPQLPRDKVTAENKRAYKDKLARSVYQAFPQFFGYRAGSNTIAHKLNAKSDLYIYFYFHGLSLLNGKGSFCFITSNSWLDVGYGADLQEFLLKHCHVKMVLDNQVRRTFANADVNSIIVLFSAPDDRHEWALDKTARFVMFRVPFEHILSPVIFGEIEEANKRKATKEYRVFPIPQEKLLEDGCELPEDEVETGKTTGPLIKVTRYIGNKWGGKYLRAPDIYWTILEKGKGKLVPLGTIAKVRFGLKTGADDWFYLSAEKARELGIGERWLKPIITNPGDKNVPGITVNETNADTNVIVIRPEDNPMSDTHLRDWIGIGENQEFKGRGATSSIPALRPSCQSRARWFELPRYQPSQVLWIEVKKRRFLTVYNPGLLYADRSFYPVFTKVSFLDTEILAALLNCSLLSLWCDLLGNAPGGSGAGIQLPVKDIESILVPDPNLLKSYENTIRVQFRKLSSRAIGPMAEEVTKDDRRLLDTEVLKCLGLTSSEFDQLYDSLANLADQRLAKSKSLC
jgi:hypothetical protein